MISIEHWIVLLQWIVAGESICNSFNSQSNYHYALKVLYSCSNRDESNRDQFKLVKTTCQGQQACQLDAIREFFGNDECPGTEDAKMTLWLEYSCVGGTDRTTTRAPQCDGTDSSPPAIASTGAPTFWLNPCSLQANCTTKVFLYSQMLNRNVRG